MDTAPAGPRRAHPEFPELAGGLRLSAEALRRRDDAKKMDTFVQMLANAEYWLSFELHAFEPVLVTAPSPLRELGVAVALKFGEHMDGRLAASDVDSARQFLLRRIAPDLRPGVTQALDRLRAMVEIRDRQTALANEGFVIYQPEPALSVHALRVMGRATIVVDGNPDADKVLELKVGEPVRLAATDEKGRPLDPPEIETDTGAPLLVRTGDKATGLDERTERDVTAHRSDRSPSTDRAPVARDVVFMVPGAYRLRVRGRASGDKKVIVR